MFQFFKKSSWKIEGKSFDFFKQLFSELPNEFGFLLDGLQKGLYRRFRKDAQFLGYYSIGFDPKQSDKSMTKGKQFEIENIHIFENGNVHKLKLTIYEGLWIGFEIDKNIIDFKNFNFDTTNIKKVTSRFEPDKKIKKLVEGLKSDKLELYNLSEIEIEGKVFYQIKDLEDGNYIGIDNTGSVFGLIHDPYKIEKIYDSVGSFVEDVNIGNFDFEKYLDS